MYESALRLIGRLPSLEKLIIDEANYYTWECPVNMNYYEIVVVCYAYRFTGHLHYAAFAKWFLDEVMSAFMEQRDAIDPPDDRANGYIPRLMWLVKEATERDPEAFETACIEWRAKRDATPDRPEMERPDMLGPDGSGYRSLGMMLPE